MKTTNPAMSMITALSLLLAGCADNGGAPPPVDCGGGAEYRFLVTELTIDPATSGISEGYNLDGEVTTGGDVTGPGCGKGDHTSPDGAYGIDNQIGPLLGSLSGLQIPDVQETLDAALNTGALTLVAIASDVDSLTDDDCVALGLVLGEALEPASDGLTPLTGDEAITIDAASLDGDGNPLISAAGQISGGVLEVADLALAISIPFDHDEDPLTADVQLDLNVSHVQLRAEITSTTLGAGETGVIGGVLLGEDLLGLTADIGIDPSVVANILPSLLDMHVDAPVGMACDGISAGITIGATEATNVTMP